MGAAGVSQRWTRGRRGLQLDPQLGVSAEPRWLRGLPQSTQGRLSACSTGAEAAKVLEEVVDSGTWKEQTQSEEASYAEVAAALSLLQQAKDKVARLEALREERRKQHAAEAAELRKRLEKERRRSLRQLLLRLAPPGSAFARKPAPGVGNPTAWSLTKMPLCTLQGVLTSPLPSPRGERKKASEVVEQGPRCFEPVTQAAA
eukprot:symbB.v1.2.008742.t1/scaffold542.1/size189608/15